MSYVSWVLELQVNDGQSDNVKPLMDEMVTATRDNEPGTLTYSWSATADGKVWHLYESYSDANAALAHLGGFQNFAERFMTIFSPTRLVVYGEPSDDLKEALAAFAPTYLESAGGFSR